MQSLVFFVVGLSLIGSIASSSSSIQDFVDQLLSNYDNKLDIIEKNPFLVDRIYRYYQQTYPRTEQSRNLDLTILMKRKQIFKENLKMILAHNQNPQSTFKLKLNHMSDWTDEESAAIRAKIPVEPIKTMSRIDTVQQRTLTVPDTYDWRNQTRVPNAVTPIKDQRHCGSCYAFAMVGALEKTYAQIYNTSGPLSPQQLIDCSYESGCEGGSFVGTFRYIKDNGDRLNLEKDYPSTPNGAKQDKCQNSSGQLLNYNQTFALQYRQLPTNNEAYMKQTVYQQGPIYVYYNAGKREGNNTILREASTKFDHYATGVYDVPGCPTHENMNHAMVIIGYGTENGTDYWLVKNSWGAAWGDNGYIKIKRNSNMCGIATWPYYAGLF
ncbi:unnamed protein product [Rotaria magnacalcarata]|uniref:Uncharacterized protein n=3 Tax=Rotaria magnacalcarata TaxID=392030 RepID=A0A814DWM9_9BILA|nr:unnamed protein product [Rotaria magnacalcarata]CAF1492112.1 unnamed protein product [Rotaria magnacalcarata]CAF1938779.1 unnamed protein product [Rotaria magnacalcarata]CAF2127686.1 unnamed protein product [Rotaria magnacalcarata]CAF2138651.1 unnamed protein product [Rotaria magnacalcarata]